LPHTTPPDVPRIADNLPSEASKQPGGTDEEIEKQCGLRLDALRKENTSVQLQLDPYGGWINAPQTLNASNTSGYFRAAKLGGAWWFVTPDGHPFVSKGVTDVNWLGAALSTDAFHELLVQKYGNEDAWADASLKRILDWGFNTAGPWTSASMAKRITHSIIILDMAGGNSPRHPKSVVTDYWDPAFVDHCAAMALDRARPYVEDKKLLGYFLDNELVWGSDHFLTKQSLLQLYLGFPDGAPGRDEALRFARESAETIAQFNGAWGTAITDWSQIEAIPLRDFRPKTEAAHALTREFMLKVFHKYAAIAIGALRAVDPNHMILGCRFHTYPGDALVEAAAQYFDVIAMAFYEARPPVKEIDAIFARVDKPFLIEEWTFKSDASGIVNPQGFYGPVVRTMAERSLAYDKYVESFMRRPYAAGYHWYKWMDNPKYLEKKYSGDNCGLLNQNDEPYGAFVEHVREVNLRVETWHAQGVIAASFPENLAGQAAISASSEFSGEYSASNVADSYVPGELSRQDTGEAWCVNGAEALDGAHLAFRWENPVTVAEIVYYGRTGWFMEECWKDYEVFAEDEATPIFRGQFKKAHGPQCAVLPKPVVTRRLSLHFLNSYGGPNPGASEVQLFGEVLSEHTLRQIQARMSTPLLRMPWVDRVDASRLRECIGRLHALHGAGYAKAEEHLRLLDKLESQGGGHEDELAKLQREVLLYDMHELLAIKRREILPTHVYTYHYEGFGAGGGLYVVPIQADAPPRELVASPNGQILDCDMSYDGKTVLFSWRQAEDQGYHLWTVNVDGTALKQITSGPWHDYNACWLPDGGIGFLSTRTAQFAYCWHAPVGILHRMNADGTDVVKLSANYLNDFTPFVLNDGQIIYTRWEYVDRPAIPIQSLWTIKPDGTNLAGYFGNRVLSPGTFMEARPIPGTTKIVCTMTGHNGPARGALGVIDREHGVNAQAAIENITPDVPLPNVNEGNGNTEGTKQYSSPIPLDSERLLASIRGPVLVRDFAGGCQAVALPAPADGMQWFCAQPVAPRIRPPVISCYQPNEKEGTYATLFLQDVYRGLEPEVKRGEVKRIRVVREMPKTVRIDPEKRAFGFQFPVISCGATYAPKDILGEVPVESDGSAYFRVPSGVPVYFMALDGDGRAVQRMRSFTHLMPGESQGCIGCHEPRLGTSPSHRGMALDSPPRALEPPEWGAGGFAYWRVVQPVLDRYCVHCHNPRNAPNGIDLTGDKTDFFSVSYETLARENQGPAGSPYVSWIPTYNGEEQNILKVAPRTWGSPVSKLSGIVASGHPDALGKPRFAMDPKSRRRLYAWMDLNVPYYDTSETAYPENEGCRRIYSPEVDRALSAVIEKRCRVCHTNGEIHRKAWTRITAPECNNFLLAPLAKRFGGMEKCGKPIFENTDDPDYQAILATLKPLAEQVRKVPRMDMHGAKPSTDVCRECK